MGPGRGVCTVQGRQESLGHRSKGHSLVQREEPWEDVHVWRVEVWEAQEAVGKPQRSVPCTQGGRSTGWGLLCPSFSLHTPQLFRKSEAQG